MRNFKIPIHKFCEDCHIQCVEKVWLNKHQNCRRGSLLKFSHVNENEKNFVKIYK